MFPFLVLIFSMFNFCNFNYNVSCSDPLGFILFGTLCDSWTWMPIFFPRLWKFSAVMSSNIFIFGRLIAFPYIREVTTCRRYSVGPATNSPLVIRAICSRSALYVGCVNPSVVAGYFSRYAGRYSWHLYSWLPGPAYFGSFQPLVVRARL